MTTQLRRSLLSITLVLLSALPVWAGATEKPAPNAKADLTAAADKEVRAILARFSKGDRGWKVRMEVWVRLMKAGPAAVPVLEEALKKESLAVRAFATQALAVMRGPAAIPKAVTHYDLSALDSARLGHVAPDFSLTDVSGKTYRLSQFRGKKAVVLTFFQDDG